MAKAILVVKRKKPQGVRVKLLPDSQFPLGRELGGGLLALLPDQLSCFNRLHRPSAHVAIAAMGSFIIIKMEPLIKVLLQLLHGSVESMAKRLPEKLIQGRPIESFYETICLWTGYTGSAMGNLIQPQEDLIRMEQRTAKVFPPVVRKNIFNRDALRGIERQNAIIENIDGRVGCLGGIEFAEGERLEGIDNGLEPDPANSLEPAHKEGVLAKKVARIGALDSSLPETGIGFFEESDLLFGQRQIGALSLFLQAQEAFIATLHVFLDPNIAHRAGADGDAFQAQMMGNAKAAPSGMLQGEGDEFLLDFGWGLVGAAFRSRRAIQKSFEAEFLEGPFVLVELASTDPGLAASFAPAQARFSTSSV